jgi:hypothetical protein
MWPAIVVKYTSSRSVSALSNPGPGEPSLYTRATVRPARSLVEITA